MITKVKGGYALKAKGTGKVLGTHSTKAGALRQERAIKAAQSRRRVKR